MRSTGSGPAPDDLSTAAVDDWAAHDGVPMLATVARALCVLEHLDGLEAFRLPYPPVVQLALDRSAVAFLRNDARPPASLAELVQRCAHIPLEDWPLRLPADAAGPDDLLIDPVSWRPTQLCHEWGDWEAHAQDPAVSHRDRLVIHGALERCQAYGEESAYAEFRRLLVQRPVLTTAEHFALHRDFALEPVWDLIDLIYPEVPRALSRNGQFAVCGRCGTLLTPVSGGEWWCERDRCRRLGDPSVGRWIDAEQAGVVHQLERPLRRHVTGPGLAEVDLERGLTALGLTVTMWPGFDAYDLLVVFPDGHRWAIDVKDWAHPGFLGRAARPVPRRPPYDEAFWVVPAYRVRERPDYRQTFERSRPASARGLLLVTDEELVNAARKRLRDIGTTTREETDHA
ncbi:Fis family transcriptional regulator [Kitasatospora sp. NPDC098663]|uniref:restriction endonuclease-related protein n=1 Tax=Kitasatospora sp. NPDC098663 TaxID=3364096 RepID=UPI00380C95F5